MPRQSSIGAVGVEYPFSGCPQAGAIVRRTLSHERKWELLCWPCLANFFFLRHVILCTGAHPDFAHGLHTDPQILRKSCTWMNWTISKFGRLSEFMLVQKQLALRAIIFDEVVCLQLVRNYVENRKFEWAYVSLEKAHASCEYICVSCVLLMYLQLYWN